MNSSLVKKIKLELRRKRADVHCCTLPKYLPYGHWIKVEFETCDSGLVQDYLLDNFGHFTTIGDNKLVVNPDWYKEERPE